MRAAARRGWAAAGRGWAAASAGVAVLLLGACATVPDSGPVRAGTGAAGATTGQEYLLQPVTAKPQPGWGPIQIVSGFLNATASFANRYAAARQYLAPGARWHPNGFAAVVIRQPSVGLLFAGKPQTRTQQITTGTASVQFSGWQLATVTSGGQYLASPAHTRYTWKVQLRRIGGQWRITSSPPSTPPLYDDDFQRVYLPRELYFVAPDGGSLIPDPVFVPLQATAVDVAKHLVTSLQDGPPQWLSGAAGSALSYTQLAAAVTMNDGTARVNLSVTEATAGRLNLGQIMAQLVWTLASPSFSQSGIVQSVQLAVNGAQKPPASWSAGRPEWNAPLLSVRQVPGGQPLYSVAARGVIQRMALPSRSVDRIPVQVGDGSTPLGAIAVSPDGRYVAWVTRSGHAVYYGPLKPGARLRPWSPGSTITSVSWAPNGSLWVVSGGVVWMAQPGHQPTLLGGAPSAPVLELRIAPDGVRAAMIVKEPGGNRLLIGAIQYFPTGTALGPVSIGPAISIGADVTDPAELAWYDPNDLLTLSIFQGVPQLREVPVNGGSSTQLIPAQGMRSISSAGPANPLAAGLSDGGLALTPVPNSNWSMTKNAGQYPTYAG